MAAGLPDVGQRRVPGLRRGEVASLAGVSVEYPPNSNAASWPGVSASILDAIARALQLDDANAPISCTWPKPPTGLTRCCGRPAGVGGCEPRIRRCSGCVTPSPVWPLCATAVWICWPPTNLVAPCTPACTTGQPERPPTSPATRFSTRTRTGSIRTGTVPPTPAWRSCAPRTDVTFTTRGCTT